MIYESVGETTRREEMPRDQPSHNNRGCDYKSVGRSNLDRERCAKIVENRIGKKKEEFSKQGFSIVASSSSSSSPGGMEIFPRGNFAMKNIRGIDIQIAIDNPNYWFNRARGKFTSIFVS